MTRADIAAETFASGLNGTQAVLSSFADDPDPDPLTARRIACGPGAGMAENDIVW